MSSMYQALLTEGALTRKEKTLLLVGLFAARREEKQMLYFVKQAVEEGNAVTEMAELIASAIISRGIPTWLSGIEAITYAIQLSGDAQATKIGKEVDAFSSQQECIDYYQREFDVLPTWIQYLVDYAPDTLLTYSNLRTTSLRDGAVSRLLKELLLYAINVCDGYKKGILIHKTNAISLGASVDILDEVKAICIYAVGIKALWNDEESKA
ncbi:carboxymuconolactone decarboxylase family protein [Lysinibacillus sp. CD3-6]|uniref:carboxymuconolactone decarboxylase family protein n=1 Tax=Lysinibacillus sp. CD3-6 TaxID=2892541 RepID=UPI0011687F7B|nr:carboxymuconolactone decarboxylase family protein [Lysinibacillus sp. CD3-6]UED80594.1 carboxymuconolactone decarboxylase family protein [Lysinibacillus sp. CD3-6]